jgi:TPP-dependent indolepyruvate ferredoxin oxidoreductase alpha subunit
MTTPNLVYERPEAFTDTPTHYCPGCTHGVAHRLVAEVLEEMGVINKTIGVAPVGCAVFAYNYFDTDFVEAPHGRAPAMATGIKRVLPDRVVFTYQGDGDLASIGMGEIVHAAARGENITVVFINNANFGMTGGQMAPDHFAGYENNLIFQRARRGNAGLSHQSLRTAFHVGWRGVYVYAVPCTTQRTSAWQRKPSAWRLKHRCADWASRWSNCSPPAPPTGA